MLTCVTSYGNTGIITNQLALVILAVGRRGFEEIQKHSQKQIKVLSLKSINYCIFQSKRGSVRMESKQETLNHI